MNKFKLLLANEFHKNKRRNLPRQASSKSHGALHPGSNVGSNQVTRCERLQMCSDLASHERVWSDKEAAALLTVWSEDSIQ